MDSITHLSHKLIAERARQQRQQESTPTPETAPPPPYSSTEDDSDSDDDDDDDCDEPSTPVKLILNAAHNIQGSNNLIPMSPTPLADATRFSTLLLHAVNQINAANIANDSSSSSAQASRRRPLRVDLTINCGITVIGDRNVIGNVGVRSKSPGSSTSGPATAVAGAKREAEEAPQCEGEPPAKRLASS